jgi:hypothetical protein
MSDHKAVKQELEAGMPSSSLTKLPPEIRNVIYHLVLRTDDIITLEHDELDARTGLLRACKKIQMEASGIFWSENKSTTVYGAPWKSARVLNAAGKDYTRCIKSLILHGTVDCGLFEGWLPFWKELFSKQVGVPRESIRVLFGSFCVHMSGSEYYAGGYDENGDFL